MRVAEKNRLETAPGEQPAIRESIKNLIGHLDAEIKRLDKDIDDKIDQTPVWKAKDEILQSIPGVGPGVARTVLAEIPELGMLTRKEIAALGRRRADEPRLRHTSGQADHRRRGRANVRTMLFLSAFAGQRHNDVLRALYLRLRAKGKPAKVAFVACMRKLITIMNAMVRTKTTWDQALAAAR